MRILFIRHADPNYKDNTITPLGHLQAAAVAERLYKHKDKITEIYSSQYETVNGRAYDTAVYTAEKLGLPVTGLPGFREISSGIEGMDKETKLKYSPWLCAKKYTLEENARIDSFDYSDWWAWKGTRLEESEERVFRATDDFLLSLGYEREGMGYRVKRERHDTVLLFAHGGSISFALAHLMNTSPFLITTYFHLYCTSITEVSFHGTEGELIVPKIERVDDHSHMTGIVYTDPGEDPGKQPEAKTAEVK